MSTREINTKKIKENKEIKIIISDRENILKETFGKVKFKKTTEQMMRETDKELYK